MKHADETVLEEIIKKLSGIPRTTPYRVPVREPKEGDHCIGTTPEYLKALYTLYVEADDELKPVASELSRLEDELEQATLGVVCNTKEEHDAYLKNNPGLKQKIEYIETYVREHNPKIEFVQVLKAILHLQIVRTFPELADKQCGGINSQWGVYWCELDQKQQLARLLRKIGVSMDVVLPNTQTTKH